MGQPSQNMGQSSQNVPLVHNIIQYMPQTSSLHMPSQPTTTRVHATNLTSQHGNPQVLGNHTNVPPTFHVIPSTQGSQLISNQPQGSQLTSHQPQGSQIISQQPQGVQPPQGSQHIPHHKAIKYHN